MDIREFYGDKNEKPLERLKPDGGFTGIFRTIACIGDSLSSGEFESRDENGTFGFHDYFEYSWGQYIARAAGCKVYNFSRGGMTAREYLDSFAAQYGYWDSDKSAQAYIMALGVNDLLGLKMELGSAEDIDLENPENNKPTFAGQYGKIIQKYRQIQPKARFFFITIPKETPDGSSEGDKIAKKMTELLYDLTKIFEFSYVIDLYNYGPLYDTEFRRNFFLGGHLNPAGYMLTATMVMSYIDYYIRQNPDDFTQAGFIGKSAHNHLAKW